MWNIKKNLIQKSREKNVVIRAYRKELAHVDQRI